MEIKKRRCGGELDEVELYFYYFKHRYLFKL